MYMASTRRLRTALGTICGSAVLLLGFAATADAATFKGTSTQGKPVKLTVDNAGVPAKFVYGWDMECKGGGSLTDGSTLSSRFGTDADVNGFKSSGSYIAEVERKFEANIKVKVDGERASDTRFTGSFKLKAKVVEEKTNEVVARCSTGIVRWTADLKGPAPTDPPPTPRFRP